MCPSISVGRWSRCSPALWPRLLTSPMGPQTARYFPGGGGRREAVARPESGYTRLPVHTHTGTVLYVCTSTYKRVCLLSQAWTPPILADSDCGLSSLISPGCHTTKCTEGPGYRLGELNTGALPAAQASERWKTSGLACHGNVGVEGQTRFLIITGRHI